MKVQNDYWRLCLIEARAGRPSLKDGNLRMKGENIYRDKGKLQKLNILKEGRPQRNAKGEITKAAKFLDTKPTSAAARVQPDRR